MTPLTPLTPRQTQVYSLIVEDAMTVNMMGKELGCSKDTIKSHMRAIFEKTGAESSLQLAVWHHTRPRAEDKR